MAAPKGNRFWEARSSHGRKPLFSSPEILWDACTEYFDWVEANPLWECKSYMYQGVPVQDAIPKMRAMTLSAMCMFLDIDENTWRLYRDREAFIQVCARAEKTIYNQKFAGASADLLNANIIARDLGLRDATDNKHSVTVSDMTEEELDRRIAALAAQQAAEN